MKMTEALKGNTYPGRGVAIGTSSDGKKGLIVYFIMGRSINSRNRVFVPDGEGIRTEAYDPALLSDPSLIIYSPVRRVNGCTVVTNGDQTDTIAEHLAVFGSFESALRTRTFEPDAPNFTPRISGVLYPDGGYALSILKSGDPDGKTVVREFFDYPEAAPGKMRLIHTYVGDGKPLPSFKGEPRDVEPDADGPVALAAAVWNALDPDNRVSLYAAAVDLATGKIESKIINAHKKS
ncbi:MAG: inosine monophosphate cyclohydrolase [Oscillospiraceae bacterium]|nr:inosine monophosphate cyclohydrolase [Oscillospiraceae bacterium]